MRLNVPYSGVLINLLPEFLAVLEATDRTRAYYKYLDNHRAVLQAYWHNYVMDLESPASAEIIHQSLQADRSDLWELIASVNVVEIVEEALSRSEEILGVDRPVDCYIMVGMGAANAGELVVGGRGVMFICLEHFTGRANPDTYSLGLTPDLIPIWVGHEYAHLMRYTSAASGSEMRRLIAEAGGYYDYWSTGSRATLRELLVNEGIAVHASQAVAPGFVPANYFGYPKRQYNRLRELDSFLRRSAEPDLERAGLGLRLRYLCGGMSPSARLVNGRVLPERSGYYLGWRMAESLVADRGIAAAITAPARDFLVAEEAARGIQTA
ncbi:MAG: DUF2268 domain-containing putative Zn-dependent protease [Gemmatimonadota bacterium]